MRIPEVKKCLEDKELIHKAKSDNTDLFRNFAVSEQEGVGCCSGPPPQDIVVLGALRPD